MIKLGSTNISKIFNQSGMDEFVLSLGLTSKKVIIKPNWVDGLEGSHTESKALDMLLTSLNRPTVVVESYTFWRTDKVFRKEGDYFSSKEATIETGKIHWDFFKKQDEWFLEKEGIDKVLKKHQAEYLNITNEVWSGDVVDSATIKSIVEARYPPVESKELYSRVPQKLFDLRGSNFISFAKAKKEREYGASLSIKNNFGLIPDPHRGKYHDGNQPESKVAISILDINKIYQSLFKYHFVIDGIYSVGDMDFDTFTCQNCQNWGVILGGSNGLEVDHLGLALLNSRFNGPMIEMAKSYKSIIGNFDESILGQIPPELIIKN
ncbi:MAG: DUF362 domain-containing protein [Candidatus Shapirobacteria bacterium]|jgi:uncharacterized protein (DUF362 family)